MSAGHLGHILLFLPLCAILELPYIHGARDLEFQPTLKHHNGVLIFTHFARAACCLLAAATPGRSTLDTKKGYKTKTGSTSSVTKTLTQTRTTHLPQPTPPSH